MKIANVYCHWHVKNLDENITVTVGTDSLVFKKGFWDFESMKKFFATKNVTLESNVYDNTCSIHHSSEDISLGDLGPFLGFPLNKTISSGTTETSPKTVNLLKDLVNVDVKSNCVYPHSNFDENGNKSSLLVKLPIDTKQVLNGSITTYQPWVRTNSISIWATSIEFTVSDNTSLKDPYTLYMEIFFE